MVDFAFRRTHGIEAGAAVARASATEVISMEGDSYRIKDRNLGRVPAATKTND